MKKILFIAILGIISSTPAFAVAGSHGASHGYSHGGVHGTGQGVSHGTGQGTSHGTGQSGGGQSMSGFPFNAMYSNASVKHKRKKAQASVYVDDPKVAKSRIDWAQMQQAAALRTSVSP